MCYGVGVIIGAEFDSVVFVAIAAKLVSLSLSSNRYDRIDMKGWKKNGSGGGGGSPFAG